MGALRQNLLVYVSLVATNSHPLQNLRDIARDEAF